MSIDSAPELRELAESARSSRDPDGFYRDQVQTSQEREKAFLQLCDALGLDLTDSRELAEARNLLQRTYVTQVGDDEEVLRELQSLARPYVDGDPPSVISALESWSRRTLRRLITISEVEAFLNSQGLQPRVLARDPRIFPAVKRLQERFDVSLRSQLVGGRLLVREETDRLLELLEQESGPRFIAVHGSAGVGKSGVLLDLAGRLKTQGIQYLPLRLDRQRPGATTRQFGESLDLRESPALCLDAIAGEPGGVLLLDQLDALKWTGAEAFAAFDTCRQMVKEAMLCKSLRIVACCRTPDLENDPLIRSWIESNQARKLRVDRLSPQTVREVVSSLGADADGLTERQVDLLRTVLLLRTWEETVRTSRGVPEFRSERELLDAFWKSRLREAQRMGVDSTTLQQAVDEVVEYLDRNNTLVIPRRLLHGRPPEVEDTLLSLNILTQDGDTIQFCHQTYLDHQLAHVLMRRIDAGETDVQEWLTNAHQALYRREQLKLILGLLRDERFDSYLATVRGLIESTEIRFHLKQLVLQFLGQIEVPCPDEIDLVLCLLDEQRWQEHVIADVLQNHPLWFEAAEQAGLIRRWLGGEDRMRDWALNLVRSVAEQRGELCHQLLAPLAARGGDWTHRVANTLPRDPAEDSDALFELRIRLAEEGVRWSFLDWSGLGGSNLPRLVLLLRALLSRVQGEEPDPQGGFLYGVEEAELEESTWDDLLAAWRALVPAAAEAMGFDSGRQTRPIGMSFSEHDHGWWIHLREFLRKLAVEQVRREPISLMALADEQPGELGELLIVEALVHLDRAEAADRGLEWLMSKPDRLRLRWSSLDRPWGVSGAAVRQLSKCCSTAVYSSVERFLVEFRESDLQSSMRFRHEWRVSPPDGQPRFADWALGRPSHAGESTYHLLPCLPADRITPLARRRLMELRRKFAHVGDLFFVGSSVGKGGSVGSPLPADRLNALSDKTWLQIIENNSIPRPDARVRRRFRNGRFEEATPGAFASDLGAATAKEPGRFARLALQFPDDVHPYYFEAVVRGLRAQPRGEAPEEDATLQQLEAVLALPQVIGNPELSRDLAWLVGSRADLDWSESVLNLVAKIATQDPDPAEGELVLRGGSEEWGPENLVDNALNCARGAATYAMAKLLFKDPDRMRILDEPVQRVARDPHPAVRAAVFDCCLAMLERDPKRAIRLALAAAEGHEALLACSSFNGFLRFAVRDHPEEMEPTVWRMLQSDRKDVVRLGASHTVALYFLAGRMEDRALGCLHGDQPRRMGAAQVAAAVVDSPKYRNSGLAFLRKLIDDESDEVLEACAGMFHNAKLDVFVEEVGFLRTYASSKAFKRHPSLLLHRLRDHGGDLVPFAECVLEVCRSLAERRKEGGEGRPGMFWEGGYYMSPVLLRLYEQAPNGSDVREQCLDAWDLLLEARVVAAMDLMKGLEVD